jgi:teichoic acid transport system ATP-binding protein
MTTENVIEIENLSKKYKIYSKPYHRFLEWATFGVVKKHDDFWALNNINVSVKKGECLGIIGHNGAGKSTLLKILSHSLWPTKGTLKIKGNIVSLLELGTGFNPELTGLDNIFVSGKLLGFSKQYLDSKLQEILDFSELGPFIYQPLKSYSSGMYVRLAFSLYANLDPDIYVVDEALSVGDIFFQQKCFDFLQKLKSQGTAILLVTHDMQSVKKYCDRVILMQKGEITHEGNPLDIVNLFYTLHNNIAVTAQVENHSSQNNIRTSTSKIEVPPEAIANVVNATGTRRGDGTVEIIGAVVKNKENIEARTAHTGDKLILHIYAKIIKDISDLTFTFQISDRHNTVVFGQNSYMIDKLKLSAEEGDIIQASFEIDMNLFQGLYTIMVGASDCQTEIGNLIYDWVEGCMTLEILRPEWRTFHGIAYMTSSFSIEKYSNVKETQSYGKNLNP